MNILPKRSEKKGALPIGSKKKDKSASSYFQIEVRRRVPFKLEVCRMKCDWKSHFQKEVLLSNEVS